MPKTTIRRQFRIGKECYIKGYREGMTDSIKSLAATGTYFLPPVGGWHSNVIHNPLDEYIYYTWNDLDRFTANAGGWYKLNLRTGVTTSVEPWVYTSV